MTDIQQWEQQLQQELTDIRAASRRLASNAAELRGRGEVRGVLVEIDTNGDITALQIAPGAMRWTSTQLTNALLDCHRKARADVKTKAERLIRKADPRIRDQAKALRDPQAADTNARQPKDEAAIQDADDAFYERRNLHGGWTTRQ
ncbi:hypothetical protein [Nocardia wallacei]|uniref:hypothetical protein n=1 Tax=Nocardia wallacei TaxID=480035 RepID=UPI0024550D30|nr:hypothetical protein [Nocardia wallacei]